MTPKVTGSDLLMVRGKAKVKAKYSEIVKERSLRLGFEMVTRMD